MVETHNHGGMEVGKIRIIKEWLVSIRWDLLCLIECYGCQDFFLIERSGPWMHPHGASEFWDLFGLWPGLNDGIVINGGTVMLSRRKRWYRQSSEYREQIQEVRSVPLIPHPSPVDTQRWKSPIRSEVEFHTVSKSLFIGAEILVYTLGNIPFPSKMV